MAFLSFSNDKTTFATDVSSFWYTSPVAKPMAFNVSTVLKLVMSLKSSSSKYFDVSCRKKSHPRTMAFLIHSNGPVLCWALSETATVQQRPCCPYCSGCNGSISLPDGSRQYPIRIESSCDRKRRIVPFPTGPSKRKRTSRRPEGGRGLPDALGHTKP